MEKPTEYIVKSKELNAEKTVHIIRADQYQRSLFQKKTLIADTMAALAAAYEENLIKIVAMAGIGFCYAVLTDDGHAKGASCAGNPSRSAMQDFLLFH